MTAARSVDEIQKAILTAIDEGQPTDKLLRELAAARARVTAEAELSDLKAAAAHRQEVLAKAEKVRAKAERQEAAITAFLAARDACLAALETIIEKAKELPGLQEACYEAFSRPAEIVLQEKVVAGILPSDLRIPMLLGRDGVSETRGSSHQALMALQACCGLLGNLMRQDHEIPSRAPDALESIDESPALASVTLRS